MRLVTYGEVGATRPGALIAHPGGDRLLDLGQVFPGAALVQLLAAPEALALVRERVEAVDPATLPLAAGVRLAAPVTPGTILCLGYNYAGHEGTAAGDREPPKYPNVFIKTANTLRGPHDPVELPPAAQQVDYEGEIAVVIGRRAHRVAEADAMDHVAGFTLFNDVSARDWQSRASQWTLGKCFDGFGPLGPAIVTRDEVPDLAGRVLEVERDGVVTVQASTDTMLFDVAFLVHYLSQVMALEPGDVISTGTPAKLDEASAVHRPLGPGDAVTIRVTGLDSLTTTFAAPARAHQEKE